MPAASSKKNFVDDDRFDGLYMNVASTAHGIEPLLDTVFSFLRRKTDFFKGPAGSTNGTQDAIRKVNEVLQKHAQLFEQENPKKASPPVVKKHKKGVDDVIEMENGGFDVSSAPTIKETKPKVEAPKPVEEPPAKKEDEKGEKEGDKEEEKHPVGNGGTIEGKYTWTQILSELSVSVPLPDNTRGRDLNVTIGKKHLKVGLKQANGAATKWIVDDDLTKTVIMDDSFWTVEDGNRLVITLQKTNTMEWWDSVCVSDPKINLQKIRPENSSLCDLDGETRQTVEKMMYDQRQKALGLPTSEELKKHEMLDKIKKQFPEMDFSKAVMS